MPNPRTGFAVLAPGAAFVRSVQHQEQEVSQQPDDAAVAAGVERKK